MFINEAYAQAADGAGVGSAGAMQYIFLIGFAAIFYFLIFRPQQKKAKEHQSLISALSVGDEVVTASGLIGKIVKMQDDMVNIETGNGVELTFQKMAISGSLPKGTLKAIK